jgi:hypothetical protein
MTAGKNKLECLSIARRFTIQVFASTAGAYRSGAHWLGFGPCLLFDYPEINVP